MKGSKRNLPGGNYKKDVFISYAHADNIPFDANAGWIELLHERLLIRLKQLLGYDLFVWWDKKQEGQKAVQQDLRVKLSEVALLIGVISPSYFESEWCRGEREMFCQFASKTGGVQDRIFKVAKTYVPLSEQPPELKELLGYEFYEIEQATGQAREFSHHKEGSTSYDKRYWAMLDDLASDLKKMILQLNPRHLCQQTGTSSGKTIYLAETTSDRKNDYDKIKRELKQRNHRILPDRPLPHDSSTRQTIMNYLAECQLSVHLIGDIYGIVSEDEQKSIVELQYELAADSEVKQLLWMPEKTGPKDERQKQFINSLLKENKLSSNADLLQNILEKLKDNIHDTLQSISEESLPPDEGDATTSQVVYLACDQLDYEAVKPIEDFLFDEGFEVISSPDQNDPKLHKENLLVCDAVLTYCGNTTDQWLQLKRNDLLQLPGYGRTKPLLEQAYYISAPQSPIRDRFRVRNGMVILNYDNFSEEKLKPFVEKVKGSKGGRS